MKTAWLLSLLAITSGIAANAIPEALAIDPTKMSAADNLRRGLPHFDDPSDEVTAALEALETRDLSLEPDAEDEAGEAAMDVFSENPAFALMARAAAAQCGAGSTHYPCSGGICCKNKYNACCRHQRWCINKRFARCCNYRKAGIHACKKPGHCCVGGCCRGGYVCCKYNSGGYFCGRGGCARFTAKTMAFNEGGDA